jgi:hypothetical protein
MFPLFATGIKNTSGTGAWQNLPLVVHLDLRISPRIFEKIEMTTLSL